jgi:hypothetical protein
MMKLKRFQHSASKTEGSTDAAVLVTNGYILLTSVLITAAVCSAIGTSILLFGIAHIRTSLVVQQAITARGLADACANEALQRLLIDTAYTGNETITIGSQTCTIATVSGSGASNRTVQASATVGPSTRRVEVTVSSVGPPMSITQWEEVADF